MELIQKKKLNISQKKINQNIFIKKFDQSNIKDVKNLIKFINKKKLNLTGVVNCAVLRPMKKGSNDLLKIGKNLLKLIQTQFIY